MELEDFFAALPDMEPVHRHDAAMVYRGLKELRRLRAQVAKLGRGRK